MNNYSLLFSFGQFSRKIQSQDKKNPQEVCVQPMHCCKLDWCLIAIVSELQNYSSFYYPNVDGDFQTTYYWFLEFNFLNGKNSLRLTSQRPVKSSFGPYYRLQLVTIPVLGNSMRARTVDEWYFSTFFLIDECIFEPYVTLKEYIVNEALFQQNSWQSCSTWHF